jgi:guanine deaminase
VKVKNMKDDRFLLLRALEIAIDGIKKGGGPFGAVVTRNGEIVAEEYNKVVMTNDPTAHAEIMAIRKASKKIGSYDLSDCKLYVSCEPCPMCLGAIYWAGIKSVIYAADRKDAAKAGFNDDFFYNEITLVSGEKKVLLSRLPDVDGKEVFRRWGNYDNKIPY